MVCFTDMDPLYWAGQAQTLPVGACFFRGVLPWVRQVPSRLLLINRLTVSPGGFFAHLDGPDTLAVVHAFVSSVLVSPASGVHGTLHGPHRSNCSHGHSLGEQHTNIGHVFSFVFIGEYCIFKL